MRAKTAHPCRARFLAFLALAGTLLACSSESEREVGKRADAGRDAVAQAITRGDRDAALAAVRALEQRAGSGPEAELEIARLLVGAGDAPAAGWRLEAAARRYPDRADVRLALGRVSLLLNDPSRAREVADSIEGDAPERADALLLQAQAEIQLGDVDEGLATLASAADHARDGGRTAAWMRIATLLSERRLDEAGDALEAARGAIDPDDDASRAWRQRLDLVWALLRAEDGEPTAAVQHVDALLESDPHDPLAWQALVGVLTRAERGDEALARVESALERDEPEAFLHALAARLHRERGNDDRAESALRALAARSDSAGAYQPLLGFLSDRGDVQATRAALDEALSRFPDEPGLRLQSSEVLLAAGQLEGARAEIERFRETTFAGDPQLDYLEARLVLAEGRPDEAARKLRDLAPRLDRAAIQYWIGRALESAGDEIGARRRYALARRRDPSWPAPTAALLELALRRGDWAETAGLARALAERAPWNPRAWSVWVVALERLGQGEAAEAAARSAVERLPDRPEAKLLLARALRAQRKTEEALAVLDEASASLGGPEQQPALVAARARTLGMAGRLPDALATARAAAAEHPDSAAVQAALAVLLFAGGQVAEGDAATERALALEPDDLAPLRERCLFRASKQLWTSARDDCARYLEARPQDAEIAFVVGVAYEQLDDADAAADAYRRAAALSPRDARPRNNLAGLLAASGRHAEALAMAQEAYHLDPESPFVLDTLGTLYLESGLARRAMRLLQEAHARAPGLAGVERRLARARSVAERTSGAVPEPGPRPSSPRPDLREQVDRLDRPHVVLVVVDTLRADRTTPYGFMHDTTPELARWAASGVLFEQVRAQSSWTKMSMASLFTSLWPASHGIRAPRDGLADAAVTLAEVLRAGGYATYAVQTNGWLHQSFGFHQGFDHYVFPRPGGDPRLGRASLWSHADRVVEEAQRLIAAHDDERPFFLYLHFMDVHEYAAPPHLQRFGTDDEGAYQAAIRWVDQALERIRRALARSGDLDRSLLVLASDHGETFGEHGVHGHARNVLTPVVSVPLVLRFPFELDPPVRVPTQVRNIDLAPTLLELAGIAAPEDFEGRSLVPVMTGETTDGDRISYAALGVPLFPDASVQRSVTTGGWTYARNAVASEDEPQSPEARARAPGAELLFERGTDPDENVDLTRLEPEAAHSLRSRLDAHLANAEPKAVAPGVRIDPSISERLRAMGYLR